MAVENHDATIFEDPATWVAVSIIIFLAFAAKKIWPKMAQSLDGYSNKIREEISNAEKLRAEAQQVLAAAQRRAAEAERTANEILERAKFEAKQIADESEKEIEREIEHKIKLADEKIQRASDAALENLRKTAVEAAIASAKEILEKELSNEGNKQKLIDKSIKLISSNAA